MAVLQVLLAVLGSAIVTVCQPCPAPRPCTCQAHVVDNIHHWLIDCRHAGIKGYVPELAASNITIEQLDLSHNAIQYVNNKPFEGLQIKKLDLSYNPNIKLTSSAFQGLGDHLEEIRIEHCGMTELSQTAFQNLHKLHHLVISYNCFSDVPDNTFMNTNLTSLWMNKNCIRNIGMDAFHGIEKSLRSLHLSNNDIEELPAIWNLQKLKTLDISGNRIKGVYFYSSLKSLKSLHLDGNKITAISNSAFAVLSNLRWLNLEHNEINSISSGAFSGLNELQELYLDTNEIREISPDTFKGLESNLHILHISRNKLTSSVFQAIKKLEKLHTLYLSKNGITAITSNGLGKLQLTLRVLDLSSNKIQQFESEFWTKFHQLKELNLSYNNLTSGTVVFPATGLYRNTLKTLNLEGMNMVGFPKGTANLQALEKLYLCHNKIQTIPNGLQTKLPQLLWLDVSQNALSKIPVKFLRNHPRLTHLYFTDNRIVGIMPHSFVNLKNLKSLVLKGNRLQTTSIGKFTFSGIENSLNTLDLSHNQITEFPECVFNNLTKLQELYYNHNPIHCNCAVRWLKKLPDRTAKCASPIQLRNTKVVQTHILDCPKAADDTCKNATWADEVIPVLDQGTENTNILQSTVTVHTVLSRVPTSTSHVPYTKISTETKSKGKSHKKWHQTKRTITDDLKLGFHVDVKDKSIFLSWILHHLKNVTGFVLSYRKFGTENKHQFLVTDFHTRNYTITEFNFVGNYVLCITAQRSSQPFYQACREIAMAGKDDTNKCPSSPTPTYISSLCIALIGAMVCLLALIVAMVVLCYMNRKQNSPKIV